jgi:uncharacterized protein
MNILIDTNVLLSAALRDRLPEKVVRYVATEAGCRWLITLEIHQEYLEVLKRPKFGLTREVVQHWSALIEMRSILVSNPLKAIDFSRDPKDAPYLSAAIATGADYLVTGDKDLLYAKLTISTRIVTVGEFATEFCIS